LNRIRREVAVEVAGARFATISGGGTARSDVAVRVDAGLGKT